LYGAFRLYREYRNTIYVAAGMVTGERSAVGNSSEPYDFKNKFAAHLMFRNDYFNIISGSSSGMNSIYNIWYYEKIMDYAVSKTDLNLIPVLKRTAVNTEFDEYIRQRAAEAVRIIQENSASYKPGDEKMSDSIRALSGTRKPQTTEILRLLRESSIESKRQAIFIIGKFGFSDLSTEVCGCLSIPGLTSDASEVLKSFGQEAESALIRLYLSSSGNTVLCRTILQLLGKRCNSDISGFLFLRLWANSRQVKELAIKYLVNCKFKPADKETERLNQLSSEIIGIITWCLAVKIALVRDNDTFLLDKIKNEITRWYKFLYSILSITYNSGTVAVINENIETGTMESVSYALEMTDTMVSDIIKPQLIYLLDLVPDEVKLRNLYQFYALEIPDRKKILEDIINRDYNLISLWTKACALRKLTGIDDYDIAESVTALLFSPEEIIREEAAYLITRSNPELYVSASERIPDSIKNHLDNIISGTRDKSDMLFEKTQFLSAIFGGILEDELLGLASRMTFKKNINGNQEDLAEGFINWTIPDDNQGTRVIVLYDGAGDSPRLSNNQWKNIPCYTLPLVAVEQYLVQYPDNSREILKYIDDNES
jgi:hypothetical protein